MLSSQETIAADRAALGRCFTNVLARLQALTNGETLRAFDIEPGSRLERLAQMFQLSSPEREILTLSLGAELDPEIANLIANTTGQAAVTLSLADRLIGSDVWDALCPESALRHWRLVELQGGGQIRDRAVRVDERILHFVLGTTYLDMRLEGLISVVGDTAAPDTADVDRVFDAWAGDDPLPVLVLAGRDTLSKRRCCAAVADRQNRPLFLLNAQDIPQDGAQRAALSVLIEREQALSGAVLLIEAGEDLVDARRAAGFADLLGGPTILGSPDPLMPEREPRLRIDLTPPDRTMRRAIWEGTVAGDHDLTDSDMDQLAEQFTLDASTIRMAAAVARESDQRGIEPVWQAAREQARGRLDQLADRIDSAVTWDDLVLAPEQMSVLRDLEHHLRQSWAVNQHWGWAARGTRGLGTAVLFAGASGTGKTLAAEVIANSLSLDLFRIDLSQVVSKYIGETEKNLSRIFVAAEDGGAILLFDEADALFGKRSEVKDSHDRYANVEVSYLLQRMESYRGLAILTTNQKSAVDQAFLRRLRYVVNFAFPDAAAREQIWAGIFPPETPTEGLDFKRLSRLSLTGGSIRSIAFNAAFLAAGAGEPVRMRHIARAAQREYAKLEKPMTGTELETFR